MIATPSEFQWAARKLPTYEEMKHTRGESKHPWLDYGGKDDWAYDTTIPSLGRYKQNSLLRVYESGRVVVTACVHKAPDTRRMLATKYGLQFVPVRELRGVKLYAPRGELVHKAHFSSTSVLFMDSQTKRAYGYDCGTNSFISPREDAHIEFAHKDAVPSVHANIHMDIPDYKRSRDMTAQNKERLEVYEVTYKLYHSGEPRPYSNPRMRDTHYRRAIVQEATEAAYKSMFYGLEPEIPEEVHEDVLECLAGGVAADLRMRAMFDRLSAEMVAYPWLKVVLDGEQ